MKNDELDEFSDRRGLFFRRLRYDGGSLPSTARETITTASRINVNANEIPSSSSSNNIIISKTLEDDKSLYDNGADDDNYNYYFEEMEGSTDTLNEGSNDKNCINSESYCGDDDVCCNLNCIEQKHFSQRLRVHAQTKMKESHELDYIIDSFVRKAEERETKKRTEEEVANNSSIVEPLLEPNTGSITTIREFSIQLVEWSVHYHITEKAMLDMLCIFHQSTKGLNLPIKVIISGDNNEKKELKPNERVETCDDNIAKISVTNDWDQYIIEDTSILKIDICINGCEAFCGGKKENLYCSICKEKRFSNRCPNTTCRVKSYDSCNPFKNRYCIKTGQLKAPHKVSSRTPKRRIYYRSIIQNLCKLNIDDYKMMVDDPRRSLNYLQTRRQPKDSEMEDIVDSPAWKNIYNSMQKYFESFSRPMLQNILAEFETRKDFKIIPFFNVINCFSDSMTLFKRKNESLHAHLTSITNCDPKTRMVLGRGLFLTYLHAEKKNSSVSKFLCEELLIHEQQKLEQGVAIM